MKNESMGGETIETIKGWIATTTYKPSLVELFLMFVTGDFNTDVIGENYKRPPSKPKAPITARDSIAPLALRQKLGLDVSNQHVEGIIMNELQRQDRIEEARRKAQREALLRKPKKDRRNWSKKKKAMQFIGKHGGKTFRPIIALAVLCGIGYVWSQKSGEQPTNRQTATQSAEAPSWIIQTWENLTQPSLISPEASSNLPPPQGDQGSQLANMTREPLPDITEVCATVMPGDTIVKLLRDRDIGPSQEVTVTLKDPQGTPVVTTTEGMHGVVTDHQWDAIMPGQQFCLTP